jgi:hypothetical protein
MNDPQIVNLSVDNHTGKHFITVDHRAIFVLIITDNSYSVPLF